MRILPTDHLPGGRRPRRLAAAAVAAAAFSLGAASTADAHPGPHEPHGDKLGARAEQQLDAARDATKRYRKLAAAKRDGYVLDSECVSDPEAGGMGFHAFSEELMADGKLDPRKPEILVYARNGYDKLRLVALEYFAPDADGDASTDDRPKLFGQPFDGPFPGAGDAPVYLLHAWVHKRNPAGVFAPFNPRVSC